MGTIYPTVPVAREAAEPWPQDDGPDAIRTDELFAARLDNELADELHALHSGLAGKTGDDALAAIGELAPAIAGLKDRYLGQALGARQKSLVEPLVDARIEQTGRLVGGLARRATLELDDQVTGERLAGFRRDAASAWDDPEQLRLYGRATVQELRYQGERSGWDAADTDSKVRAGLSDLYAGAVEAAIDRDPDGAAGLYDHAREAIDPARRAGLDRRLAMAREDRTVAGIGRALMEQPLDPAAPPDAAAMAARIAELTPEEAGEELRMRIAQVGEAAQRRLERQWTERQAEAGLEAFDWRGRHPDDPFVLLPWRAREWLAPDQWNALERWEQNGFLATDPELFERLDWQMVYEPEVFRAVDLGRHRLSLGDTDHARFAGLQKAFLEGASDPSFVRYKHARLRLDGALDANGIGADTDRARLIRANVRGLLGDFETAEGRPANIRDVEYVVDKEVAQAGPAIGADFGPRARQAEDDHARRVEDRARILSLPQVAESPRLKKVLEEKGYSKVDSDYHEFDLPSVELCTLGEPGCSVDGAYQALRHYGVPGGPQRKTPIEDGETSEVSLGGFSGGHIKTHVEESTHSVIHVTQPDHIFHDGIVQRRIVVEGDKVVLRNFGIGNNGTWFNARVNDNLAGQAMAESNEWIKSSVKSKPDLSAP